MTFSNNVGALATRVGEEIKAVRGELGTVERITAATLASRVSGSSLVAGRMYQITDAPFLAVATSTSTYDTYYRITVSSTAPSSPLTGELWVDIT